MSAFSRLQLAAALLEYDNDPDNPNAPRRSAQDSAIFSPLRRANGYIRGATVEEATRTRDLLGVALPSEAGGSVDVKSTTMKSRTASVDLLQNPFGGDDEPEPEEEEEPLEVDLKSWGLDSFMPKEKGSKASRNSKGKAKSEILPGTRNSTFGVNDDGKTARVSHGHTRAMSDFGMGGGGAFLDSIPENGMRRNSVSNPLDMDRDDESEHLVHRFRTSSYGVIEDLPVKLPLHQRSSFIEANRDTIPFPTSSSPGPDSELGLGVRSASRLDERSRAHSDGTLGATVLEGDENNPFAIPPPPEERASRFDPKYAMSHARTNSNATRLSAGPQQVYDEEVFDERAGSRMSGFGGKQRRDRRVSAASFGTRDMLDDDDYAYDGFEDQPMPEKRYSRLDLMRPKVLIMPSPLQNENIAPPPPKPSRDGFLDSSDARPLPPGARSSSRLSMLQSSSAVNIPAPGNSFTPNPRLSLSASQLLFRNNLTVDGQRDVAHRDVDGKIRRAEKDGEKVQLEFPEDIAPQVVKPEEESSPIAETSGPFRPAGKLFGRSLIDDLESRKQQMKNKARVFYGDQRPSMMDRGPKRSSTLIDPASLQMAKPTPNRTNSAGSTTQLQRKGSRGGKPLLTFDEDGKLAETTALESAVQPPQTQLLTVPGSGSRNSRVPKAQSVFGADKLWEKEMERLEVIKAQEKVDEEERRKREEVEEAKRSKKKGRGKKKSKKHEEEIRNQAVVEPAASVEDEKDQQEAVTQPLLPDITKVTTRRRTVPVPVDDDSDDESSASEAGSRPTGIRDEAADKWVSDDEEGGKAKVSAMGGMHSSSQFGGLFVNPTDDSDEDIPLSMALQRRASKNFLSPRSAYQGESDSDEDRPLSTLLLPSKSEHKFDLEQTSSPRSPLSQSKGQSFNDGEDEEEDNVPLGIRASRIPTMGSGLFSQSGAAGGEDEDDRPLGMHPEQIRRSQYQAFNQMQQQQQMYEAQMRSSMMFNPMMMMPPVPAFAPPSLPSQDNVKFGRVDRWRRDVAVEGEA